MDWKREVLPGRFYPNEANMIRAIAERKGMSVSAFIRKATLNQLSLETEKQRKLEA